MNDPAPNHPSGEDDCIERALKLVRQSSGEADGLSLRTPSTIDGYTILGCLGSGGTATVYKAQRGEDATPVALKVLHSLLMTDELLRRFSLESRLLSGINHPGIVHVYGSGTHTQGNATMPYIAMEWIDGLEISDYCRHHALGVTARMKLLVAVCGAVQHAHQKGIVHRDLKSANVLVDQFGQPRVLDFGVARLVDSSMKATTMHTQAGQWLGTLPYMSPEQLGNDPNDIDTRSDVYGLGVIGYELFAGTLPFSPDKYSRAELVHAIRKEPPVSLGKYSREYRGDIETIIGKSIEKDRTHRYDTVAELAADLSRSIDNEPILARRTGTLGKLYRWHRREPILSRLWAALALAMAILMGSVVVFWQRSAAVSERRRVDLYLAEMNLAAQAYRINDSASIRRILNRHIPSRDQTDLRCFAWYFLWDQVHGEQHRLSGHLGPVYQLAFSPDSRWMASCGRHRVLLWNTTDWEIVAQIDEPGAEFNVVCFSPDGRELVTGDDKMQCRSWSVPSMESVGRIELQQHVQSVAFSPDGSRLAIGTGHYDVYHRDNAQGDLSIWDYKTRKRLWHCEEKVNTVTSLDFTPDGSQIVAAHANDKARLWTPISSTWKEIASEHVPNAVVATVSPDGKSVAVSGWNDRVAVWDLGTERVSELIEEVAVQQLAFSSDGTVVATLSYRDTPVNLWKLPSSEVSDQLHGHEGDVHTVTFSPNGQWIATAGQDRTIRIWETGRSHGPRRIPNSWGEIDAMSLNHDETRLALGDRQGNVRVLELASAETVYQSHTPDSIFQGAELSADGQTLVVGSQATRSAEGTVDVIDLRTSHKIASLGQRNKHPAKVAYSPSGDLVAISYLESIATQPPSAAIDVFDSQNWTRVRGFAPRSEGIQAVAFSPNSQLLAAGSDFGSLFLWKIGTGELIATGDRFKGTVADVQFSPDGKLLAVGTWPPWNLGLPGPEVRICRADTLETVHQLWGHVGGVYGVGFAPDGLTLATGGGSGIVKLWDVATGRHRAELQTPGIGWVFNVRFSPDGRHLYATYGASTGRSGVYIWEAVDPHSVQIFLP